MDCNHERQARLDQWIEDQTGSACAFCLKDEVEKLKASNENLGNDYVLCYDKYKHLQDTNDKLREALEDIKNWVEQIENDERISGWIHQEDYGLYCLLAGGCPVNFEEALKEKQ